VQVISPAASPTDGVINAMDRVRPAVGVSPSDGANPTDRANTAAKKTEADGSDMSKGKQMGEGSDHPQDKKQEEEETGGIVREVAEKEQGERKPVESLAGEREHGVPNISAARCRLLSTLIFIIKAPVYTYTCIGRLKDSCMDIK
jgi:hypothetical protein